VKKWSLFLTGVILLVVSLAAACTPQPGQSFDFGDPAGYVAPAGSVNGYGDYFIKVLVLEEDNTFKSQLQQSLVYNVEVDDTPGQNLNDYDLIVAAGEPAMEKEKLLDYARRGGFLLVYNSSVPGVLNTAGAADPAVKNPEFPGVPGKLEEIQEVLKTLAAVYNPVTCTLAAEPAPETDILMRDTGGNALALHREVGEGHLFWFTGFIPEKYTADISFRSDKPFNPGYAAITGYILDEVIHLAGMEKYGFSLERPMGPYGTPVMAWQNHYEAAEAFAREDYKTWYYLLQEYRQVPTFSLIRGSYDWGFWWAGICLCPNEGENGELEYRGFDNDSFYACGDILRGEKGYIRYGPYPGYNTLMSELENPFRVVPQIIEDKLMIGAPGGKVYIAEQSGKARYTGHTLLEGVSTGGLAAPYYENGYLVLGGDETGIKVYREKGDFSFSLVGDVQYKGENISLKPPLVPVLYNGDLYVGDARGNVFRFWGQKGDFNYPNRELIVKREETHAAPFPCDLNGDGAVDLLVGGRDGKVARFINHEGVYNFSGYVRGETGNFFYTRDIKIGQYSVPRLTEEGDLYLGGAMYALPYDISDGEFPYHYGVSNMVNFLDDMGLSPGAHLMVNPGMTPELENRAYELHARAFEELGAPWEDMGVNHHSWFITNPHQSFSAQAANGIRFNFGWRPPGISGAPKDAQPFAVIRPFLYHSKEGGSLLLYQPAPNISVYEDSWRFLAEKRMPLTYFQHIEYLNLQRPNLDRLIGEIEHYRQKYGYVFGTEYQMAGAMAAAWHTNLHVKITGERLEITPFAENMPGWVGAYAGAAGVTVRTEKDTRPFTDSIIQHYADGKLTLGFLGTQTVDFQRDISPQWWITRTNSPVQVRKVDENLTVLNLPTSDFQEIHFGGRINVLAYTGENVFGTRFAATKSVTHYGSPITIHIQHKCKYKFH